MKHALTCCAVGAAIATAGVAAAADLHVPAEYPTIQAAIDAARPGDVVIVADGVYTGDGNRDLTFGGKGITVRSANGAESCFLVCGGTPEVPYRGFAFTSGEPQDAVVDGFTITGGATLPGAIADQFNGGGILVNNGSSPTIRNCTLINNQCGCWGAAICITQASPTILNCRIEDNAADDDGGGIFHWLGGNPVIDGCVIIGNSAEVSGGGIVSFGGGQLAIRNSTIVGNASPWGAGGVYAWDTVMMNSIVRGNVSNAGQVSGPVVVTYSNVEGGYAGDGNTSVDPMFVDAASGDYHLAASSPLIDAGSPATPVAPGDVDFDGDPRVVGQFVDVGADEFRAPGDLTFDGAVDVADLLAMLAEWGACDGCMADLNGDGEVDVTDLLALLGGWTA